MTHNTGDWLITPLHGFAYGPILPHSHKQYQDKPVLRYFPDVFSGPAADVRAAP